MENLCKRLREYNIETRTDIIATTLSKIPGIEYVPDYNVLFGPTSRQHSVYAVIGDSSFEVVFAFATLTNGSTAKDYDNARQKLLCNDTLYSIYLRIFGVNGLPHVPENVRAGATFIEALAGILYKHAITEMESGVKFNDTKYMKFISLYLFK